MKSLLPLFSLAFATVLYAEPLKTGAPVPDVAVRTDRNEELNLKTATQSKPAVIIFYRGGWCPFCTKHLAELGSIEPDLIAAGFQILAISTDTPEQLREKPATAGISYTLLSDSRSTASQAFGIAFKVSGDILTKYKGFGIDLKESSGQDSPMLPHPAVFITDKTGIIRYAYVNEDYKVRLKPDKILAAAKALTAP